MHKNMASTKVNTNIKTKHKYKISPHFIHSVTTNTKCSLYKQYKLVNTWFKYFSFEMAQIYTDKGSSYYNNSPDMKGMKGLGFKKKKKKA